MKKIYLTAEEKADLETRHAQCHARKEGDRIKAVMNEHVRNSRFFKSAKDFKKKIEFFFNEKLPKIGGSLEKRLNDNFQCL